MRVIGAVGIFISLFIGNRSPVSAGINRWTSLGPDGGPITALAIDPQDPRTLYAATGSGALAGNGVFKSVDGGVSWMPASSGLPASSASELGNALLALAIDPHDTSTIYAAACCYGASGVYKTTDSGANWKPARSGLPIPDFGGGFAAEVLALVIDPANSSIVYAGTPGGVYKTMDGGGSWMPVNSGLPAFYVTSLAIASGNPQTLYAGGRTSRGYPKVFKTTDRGASWNEAGELPLGSDWLGIPFLITDPENPQTVYAGTGSGGVFKSIDSGETWRAVTSGIPEILKRTLGLAMDPRNPGTLYAIMLSSESWITEARDTLSNHPGSLFRSTDGGESWVEADSGLPHALFDPLDICSYICAPLKAGLAVDPEGPGIYAGTAGDGVFKSTDQGASWRTSSAGLRAISVRLAVDPGNPGTLYAVDRVHIFKTVDAGMSWTSGPWGVPEIGGEVLAVDPRNPNTVFAGSGFLCESCPDGKLFQSMDGGMSWHDTNLQAGIVEGLAIDPEIPSTVYVMGGLGVFKTTDGAATWSTVNPPTGFFTSPIVLDPQNSSTLYVGSTNGGIGGYLLKSTNGGASWVRKGSLGEPGSVGDPIYAVAVDPQNRNTIYVGSTAGVFKSTDGGTTWTSFSSGMPRFPYVLLLLIDPQNPRQIYANTRSGLFRTADGGETWNPIDSGLPGEVHSLAFDPQDSNTLYGATAGGIYAITFAEEQQ
jgi:photosystem II stability/assembly factor-like uncharacterized protein